MTATEAILNYATMQGRTFHRKDLLLDVARRKENIRVEAIDLQINRLIASGMLRRVGHGEYELTDNSLSEFVYRPSEAEKEIFGKLKRQFPFLDFCIWSPKVLASFMLHVPNIGYTFVDVEKDGMESVFNALQGMELNRNILLSPSLMDCDRYLTGTDAIVVRQLIGKWMVAPYHVSRKSWLMPLATMNSFSPVAQRYIIYLNTRVRGTMST